MAGKRALYQPAPANISRDKKTRRPLVQGRLVTDTGTFNTEKPQLVQGQLVAGRNESWDDPTIQPAMSLPTLTERLSPHPEPLQCLDLSDGEVDVKNSSRGIRPKPVMVYDASHLNRSLHCAEVKVVAAYENSPARVICHTPGKLERSLRAEQSGGGLASSGGDHPSKSVKVERVLNFDDFRSESHHQSPLLNGDVNKTGVREAETGSKDNFISQRSRGIIEEILVQEFGTSSVENISLHSDITPVLGHQGLSGMGSTRVDFVAGGTAATGSSQITKKKTTVGDKQTFPQPKFEDEADDLVPVKDIMEELAELSASETCSLHEYVTPNKSQRKPVVDGQKSSSKNVPDMQQTEASLLNKKKKMKTVPSRYLLGTFNTSDIPSLGPTKLLTLDTMHPSQTEPSSRSRVEAHSRSHTGQVTGRKALTARSLTGQVTGKKTVTRSHVKSKKPCLVKSAKSTSLPTSKAANIQVQQTVLVPTIDSFVRSDSPQESGNCSAVPSRDQKTSTPTHNQTCHLSQDIDASAIHSMSTISVNSSMAVVPPVVFLNHENRNINFTSERPANKRRPPPETTTTPGPSQLQLDIQYSRYLQWAFLNSKAKKVFHEQEQQALAQIHGLMSLLEARQQEKTQLEQDVGRLKRINLLNSVLDKTEPDLESVTSQITQVQENFSRLAQALDTTRHQLPTRDIYIPENQDLYEEKLEEALKESAQLLSDINVLTKDKTLPLSQYVDAAEAVDKNVYSILGELGDSQKDVATLQGLTTRLTSLQIQNVQVP